MKRIDKIYNYLMEKSQVLNIEDLKNNKGFSASEISEALGILRNNVSMELNTLLRQNKVLRIKGRPVLYIDKTVVEKLMGLKLKEGLCEIKDFQELVNEEKTEVTDQSPFSSLIGADSGLKNQIEQAKAAMLYPPNGLHTLIVGQTGVGKTLFANMMYSYAKYAKRLKENAPFIVFNCADYYNNPQLLISHIFGHIKGAFTGAESEKEGIVEKANNGILFLDEIHRLSPEGQEMIFYFMDTGTFNRLGESERKRKANVLIIGATTEEPGSSLLKTFVRRIPIVINIPSLEDRPVKDRLDIVKFLLSNEAHRVNKSIKVEADAVKALIGSASYGNVGQMKSNIQLVCAKGFLNCIEDKESINIEFKALPSDIKSGLFNISSKRKELEEISEYTKSHMVILPNGSKNLIQGDDYEPPFNLYKIIEDKAALLKEEGVDEEYIKNFITTDINIHIKSFYDKFKNASSGRNKILEIISEDMLLFSEEVKAFIEKKFNKKLSERFLYALGLHLSSFIKRVESKKPLQYENIEDIIKDSPEQFNIALEIKRLFEEKYNILVPEMELIYLTILLNTTDDNQNTEHVAVIVAAHGTSTASSMVSVTRRLLGEGIVEAIDMPLEISPKKVLDEIIEKVKEVNAGRGVLLLVDMGSLANFDTIITDKTGIKVKTIDMVSTALVLEAVRKSNLFDMDLDTLYDSLKGFKGYGNLIAESKKEEDKEKAIITICSTGVGTAEKLTELVANVIKSLTDETIKIIPVSVKDLNKKVESLKEKFSIIASVGILNPNIESPFISLEALIGGNGEEVIAGIIKNNHIKINPKHTNTVVKDLCEDSLKQFLTYLNPSKIIGVLMEFLSVLENNLKKNFDNAMRIRILVHVGCALERMVIKDGLVYKQERDSYNLLALKCLEAANEVFRNSLNIELSKDELFYICDMLE
ncbi:sigma 54-interacting transcriptional regulator [Clostridium swellfunianum]|uniref:sigma-54-dependent transcriptional regulator n=1 Tax=Clostridium swellfunianum TaxID=1367462 RepID=UPI002030BD41|nr:sigma-54-dependent transcriptional regulator [Clostridium swellfunianum]MCM0647619.1 sigma 54-interacting transcriptional regulator [Clostridium swellfunianum]